MTELVVRPDRGQLQSYNPERHRLTDAAIDFGIEEAKRIKDWPTLERAVDEKIEEQQKFVAWWGGAVRNKGERANLKSPGTRLFVDDAEDLTGMKQQRVSDLGKRLAKPDKYRERLLGASYHAAMLEIADSQLVQQSLSNEHYTPQCYLDAAREVLGGIDLDPASCVEANRIVGAASFFSADEDGLQKDWSGRIWLNPPYGRNAGNFVGKFVNEYAARHIECGIILVNAHCTDTDWFQSLWDGVLCFTDHRINFYGDDERSGSTHGSVFAYFGANATRFAEIFSEFGAVVRKYGDA